MGLIIFIYGIVIGSFLNVCIYRIPKGESIVLPPSHCGRCNHRLGWLDLMPILSYIYLKGRCRYCGEKISFRYLGVELLTGLLLVGVYITYGLGFNFFKYAILTLFLIVIALIDYDTTNVYSCVVYPGIALGAVFAILERVIFSAGMGSYIAGAAIGLVIIGGIYLLTGGFGAGDIEIAVLCGVFLGWQLEIYFILLSFIIGGAIGIILILMKKKSKTDYMPLGPSLAIGAYIVVLMGEELILRLIGLS